jgi:hypothetical protein
MVQNNTDIERKNGNEIDVLMTVAETYEMEGKIIRGGRGNIVATLRGYYYPPEVKKVFVELESLKGDKAEVEIRVFQEDGSEEDSKTVELDADAIIVAIDDMFKELK